MKGPLKIVLRLSKWMNVVAGATLVFMMLLTAADVVLRSFGRPIPGTYEMVALSGVVLIGFSLPYTSWTRGHVFVDFVVLKLPHRGRNVMNIMTRILGMCFYIPAGCCLVVMGMDLQRSGEVTADIQMPFYPLAYAMAVCCFIQCLVVLSDMIKIAGGNMSNVWLGVIGLLALLGLFLTGLELGVAMGLIGFLGFGLISSFHAGFTVLAQDIFETCSSYGFTVIPLFIFMGQIAFNAGIARNLYDAGNKFVGHIPGGLAMGTVLGAAAFKAVCGSAIATAATFASVAVPEMDRFNYDKRLSTGIVATVGTLGILVPPSGVLIIFGMITQQSIGRLFLAGLIPGLIITIFFIAIIYGWSKLNPALGPKGERSTWKARIRSLPEVIWVAVIFLIVIGGLMEGFFTPTEAGGVGAAAVLLVAVVKRTITWKGFMKSVAETLKSSCMILILIVGSSVLGHFLAITKIPMLAADWTTNLPLNRYVIVILISMIYQLGGSFIDDIAFMILATPIFYPVVIKLGFDPIWFGMIIAITLMIGVVIPPVASNVFVVKNITKVPFGVIYRGVYPFLASLVVAGALLFLFPQLALFLPNLLMK